MSTVWQPLQIGAPDAVIGLDETGVVAAVSSVLVRHDIELFYWSTFSTGITLIPTDCTDAAVSALSAVCNITCGDHVIPCRSKPLPALYEAGGVDGHGDSERLEEKRGPVEEAKED